MFLPGFPWATRPQLTSGAPKACSVWSTRRTGSELRPTCMACSSVNTKCCSIHNEAMKTPACLALPLRQALMVKQLGHQPRAWPCCSAAGRPQQRHRKGTHLCCQLAIAPCTSPALPCRSARLPLCGLPVQGNDQTKTQLQSNQSLTNNHGSRCTAFAAGHVQRQKDNRFPQSGA